MPRYSADAALAAPLKNPKTTINYCAVQKKRRVVAQTVQRKPRRRKMGAILAGYRRVSTRKKPRVARHGEVAAKAALPASQ